MTESKGVDPTVADPNALHDLTHGLIPRVATTFADVSHEADAACGGATTRTHGEALVAWLSVARQLQAAAAECGQGLWDARNILVGVERDFVEVDGLNARRIGSEQSDLGYFEKRYPTADWVRPDAPELDEPDTELPRGGAY